MNFWNRNRQKGFAILVALLFLFNSMCMLAVLVFPSVSDFGDTLMLGILIAAIICFVPRVKFVKSAMLVNIVLLVWILLSYMLYDYAEEIYDILYNYLVWGFFVSVVLMQDYDFE